ncbi:MAG: DUF192 domain-containing protein [Candidatus Altiarchaeales archaeon]|nr:DUF192 domain-containing protein [Candidatus Altiarchaeota archaeon]MCG2783407.1 DUF192 domain-containing protein [Candidatus Altiarchaeales archaeon]MBU4266565.1 DUF192 domain-containing protein [Candidatus Altiarchaeota archaeon]MBU4341708.1 DUF192 domain-containing protein [Candidatus Altiarchaeota archaeon]MBU4406979.1 DUF192 domain-containing protein [Candidatus Altiarchaeota archaeon]
MVIQVLNKSRGFVISESCDVADSFFSRFRGLMLSGPKDLVLVSPREDIKSSTIHMLFMRFPIDVIWVDSDMVVIEIKKGIKPNSLKIFKPKKPAKFVVELGIGKLGTTDVGDRIEFSHPDPAKPLHQPL